jgi:hypothetical protein
MVRKSIFLVAYLVLALGPVKALACAGHMYLDPDKMGFFGGAMARMAGLAPPEPIFELEHVEMAKAVVGEEGEIVVGFARPFFSKDVRLTVSSTENIKVLDEDFPLEERAGKVRIRYEALGSGFETMRFTVSGQHKGETVREFGRIYISAADKEDSQDGALQVSGR